MRGARLRWGLAGALLGLGLAGALYVGLLGRARWAGPAARLPAPTVEALEALGEAALASEDIPVAAVLLYEGEIVGRGHNTVRRDGHAGGHAEIVALSEALARYGPEGFAELDRGALVLVSTFEPCPMCQGALALYDVRKVTFLRAKTVGRQLELERRRLEHLWTREQAEPVLLQEQLFSRHPRYPGRVKTSSRAGP